MRVARFDPDGRKDAVGEVIGDGLVAIRLQEIPHATLVLDLAQRVGVLVKPRRDPARVLGGEFSVQVGVQIRGGINGAGHHKSPSHFGGRGPRGAAPRFLEPGSGS